MGRIEINVRACRGVSFAQYTIVNDSGATVTLSSAGAELISALVPDGDGRLSEIVVSSSISDDNLEVWHGETMAADTVRFTLRQVSIEYRWTDDNALEVYISNTDPQGEMIVRQAIFNLDAQADAVDQYLWVNASRYYDSESGLTVSTVHTPLDFTKAKKISANVFGKGTEFIIDDWQAGVMNEVAVLASHQTKRELRIYSTYPRCEVSIKSGSLSTQNPVAGISIVCKGDTSQLASDTNQLIFYEFGLIS